MAVSPIRETVELVVWRNGDSFGEVGIFFLNEWGWNMRCAANCTYYTVPTPKFLTLVAHNQGVSQKLVKYVKIFFVFCYYIYIF